MAIKVRLKPKAKKDGSQRIFLDIWHHRRWHEATEFRLTPEMSEKEVKLVKAQAEAHAAVRWAELVKGEAAAKSGELSKVRFMDYYKLVADTKAESTQDVWYGALPAIAAYAGNTRLKDIDPTWLRGMVKHLSTYVSDRRKKVLSQNTQANYYARVRATIWHAYRDELIADNPAARVRGVADC